MFLQYCLFNSKTCNSLFEIHKMLVYIDNYLNYLSHSKIQCGYAYDYLEAQS